MFYIVLTLLNTFLIPKTNIKPSSGSNHCVKIIVQLKYYFSFYLVYLFDIFTFNSSCLFVITFVLHKKKSPVNFKIIICKV